MFDFFSEHFDRDKNLHCSGTNKTFLHVSTSCESGMIVSNTSVRSRDCMGLLKSKSGSDLCTECVKVEKWLKDKLARENL